MRPLVVNLILPSDKYFNEIFHLFWMKLRKKRDFFFQIGKFIQNPKMLTTITKMCLFEKILVQKLIEWTIQYCCFSCNIKCHQHTMTLSVWNQVHIYSKQRPGEKIHSRRMEAPIVGTCERMCPLEEIKLYVFSGQKFNWFVSSIGIFFTDVQEKNYCTFMNVNHLSPVYTFPMSQK